MISPSKYNPGSYMSQAVSLPSQKNDFFDATSQFVSEKWDAAFKTVYVFRDCLEQAGVAYEELDRAADVSKQVKLAAGFGKALEAGNKLRHAVEGYLQDPTFAKAVKVLRKANGCVSPVNDSVDFLTRAVVHIPKNTPWVQNLKATSAVALVVGMVWNLADDSKGRDLFAIANSNFTNLTGVERKEEFVKLTQALISVAKNTAYLALGILTVLSTFFGFVFAPVAFVALSATTVVFTILDFYYDKWGVIQSDKN